MFVGFQWLIKRKKLIFVWCMKFKWKFFEPWSSVLNFSHLFTLCRLEMRATKKIGSLIRIFRFKIVSFWEKLENFSSRRKCNQDIFSSSNSNWKICGYNNFHLLISLLPFHLHFFINFISPRLSERKKVSFHLELSYSVHILSFIANIRILWTKLRGNCVKFSISSFYQSMWDYGIM